MNDAAVLAIRWAIIILGPTCSTLTVIVAIQDRYRLSVWQGLTRASLAMLFSAVAFATLSSLMGWDADARVTLVALALTGVAIGMSGTIRENRQLKAIRADIDAYRRESHDEKKGAS